jgi:hypothetical protein
MFEQTQNADLPVGFELPPMTRVKFLTGGRWVSGRISEGTASHALIVGDNYVVHKVPYEKVRPVEFRT